MVTVCVFVTPWVTFPKATVDGIATSCGCKPMPEREIASGELVALLVTASVPVSLPAVAGAKVALTVVAWPGASVSGRAMGDTEYPAPFSLIREIVTLEFPLLVMVTLCAVLPPTARLPKLSALVEAESRNVCAIPVPPKATTVGEPGALLTKVRLPERVPAVAGAKVREADTLPPGAIVAGNVSPERLNPEPDRAACERTSGAVPGFWMLTACALLAPVMTLPKLMLEGETLICG